MILFLSGSNRNKNCYEIASDLVTENDKLIALMNTKIEYCLACNMCAEQLENYCVQKDDMLQIYESILRCDKIVITSPIYFNQIPGMLKSLLDRLRPFGKHDLLEDKKIYLITIGELSEGENNSVNENIKNYFEELSEIFGFKFTFLKYLSSSELDDVKEVYSNYNDIIIELKDKIKLS